MDLNELCNRPLKLKYTRVHRNFTGGMLLEKWQGNTEPADGDKPEEWVASTIEARTDVHRANEGLSMIDYNNEVIFLRDIIDYSPKLLLGAEHAEKYGANPAVLVKLIDSCSRLYIQVHPDREFAQRAFKSGFGKTEAWYILDCRVIDGQEPYVLLGFREGVTKEKWVALFEKQDVEGMVNSLHRIPVRPGDVFFIESGVPHAIGSGCFLLEIQEPTDFTLRVERYSHDGRELPETFNHQGIGFDKMLESFHYNAYSMEQILEKTHIKPSVAERQEGGILTSIISSSHTDLFSMDRLQVSGSFRAENSNSFKVGVVLSGEGKISWQGGELEIGQADELFLPAALKDIIWHNTGDTALEVILCSPPK